MSVLFQCAACKGVYAPVQADGTLYFHVCPFLVDDLTGVHLPPPILRDENVVLAPNGKAVRIRHEGGGAVRLPDDVADLPEWQRRMAARLASDD